MCLGVVVDVVGVWVLIVSGGLLCVVGVVAVMLALLVFWIYDARCDVCAVTSAL